MFNRLMQCGDQAHCRRAMINFFGHVFLLYAGKNFRIDPHPAARLAEKQGSGLWLSGAVPGRMK
jgi:hypothetical protein